MQRYDIAIIGGGLTGCASAYYLSRGGASVVLIEKGEVNLGASGRNAGSLHFQLEHREVAHENSFSQDLAHRVALSRIAIDHWRGLEAELGEDLELAMHGGLMLAETADELALLKRKFNVERQHGLNTDLLTGTEVRRLAPYLSGRIQAAALCPEEGHCNPRLLTHAFARRSMSQGVRLLTRAGVTRIRRHEDLWQVDVTQSPAAGEAPAHELIAAGAILNAAGAWAGQVAALANYHLPIFPVGLLMNVTEKVAPFMKYLIQHVGKRISMKQTQAGNLLIGGGWPVRMREASGGPGAEVAPGAPQIDTITQNLQVATDLAPVIGDVHLIRTWSGVTGVTSDQLPVVGEISGSRGFYVAAGGSGFTFGPTYARLISELILTGRTPASATAYSPARFDHINMFMG